MRQYDLLDCWRYVMNACVSASVTSRMSVCKRDMKTEAKLICFKSSSSGREACIPLCEREYVTDHQYLNSCVGIT